MLTHFFAFLFYPGLPFFASLALLILTSVFSLVFSWQTYKYPGSPIRSITTFGLVLLASMAYVFVDMAIYGAYPTISIDSVLENYIGYLFIIFFMGVMAIVLTVIPLVYNYLMRNSKIIMRLEPEKRNEFLATNSSWFLLRLATYFFMVGIGLAGVAASAVYFPPDDMHKTLLEKIGTLAMMILPVVFGIWFGVKVLNKFNLVAYRWHVSDEPARRR